jgi:hypothetical protein
MATVLVISFTDLKRDPRIRRQIEVLRTQYSVIAAGTGDPEFPDVYFVGCTRPAQPIAARISDGIKLLLRRYESYYCGMKHVQELRKKLGITSFDVAIANDVETLPLALSVAGERPVILDAHEYAPREMEDRMLWRIFKQDHAQYLCRQYLFKAARIITVADGIAEEYQRVYGVKPTVVNNAAASHTLTVKSTTERPIRMIHHGHAMPTRQIEKMIDVMKSSDQRFELDLMLVPTSPRYLRTLKAKAGTDRRIRFPSPVSSTELVTVSHAYDIGLYLLPPSNFNNLHALPNKFFEFLQARLAIAIGPSPEMARIVRQFECGVVAEDFLPMSLSRVLNQLSSADIDRMKAGSDRAARIYNAENNAQKICEVVASVLDNF